MDHVTSGGTVIGFRRSGGGPPLVLVHGTTANHRRWAPVAPRLERDFTLYAMDRRGRGTSGDSLTYSFLREAADVAALVDAIGEPTFLLGHSYGAACSLEACLLTDGVRRLVLYEPPIPTEVPMYPPGVPERIQALVDRGAAEAALELFLREVVRMPEHELAAYRQLPVWPARVALVSTIPRELTIDRTYAFDPRKFADLRVPTMLLLGGDSPPLFRRGTEVVDAALPDSRVVVLPGQQHIAMDTAPELFVTEVRRFLLG